ncbi:hypothetical protein AMECASPLE_037361 [Ameca splendens]|uniref:Uncharacterized protein n=1 Tax=Ameca splendens TaxID=208324 RepID=A0ABV0Z6J2_9TELE
MFFYTKPECSIWPYQAKHGNNSIQFSFIYIAPIHNTCRLKALHNSQVHTFQFKCERPSATTDWGFERTEQRHKENKEALIQESFLWEGKVNVNGCSSFSRFI